MNLMKKKRKILLICCIILCYDFLWVAVCRNSCLMHNHYIPVYYSTSGTIYYFVRNAKQYIKKTVFEIIKKLMKGMWEYVGILQNKL